MEAKIFKSLMHFKTNELDDFQDWSFVSAYNPDYTSRSMRPASPDNLWQWRNIWGSILFVLQIVDIRY